MGSPQMMQRPSRRLRNWDLRWLETGKSVNSSLILRISVLEQSSFGASVSSAGNGKKRAAM
jgi:hypothetical protein